MAAGKQRSPQGEGCRWLLMPGGGGEVLGRGNGCCRPGKVKLLVRNEVRAEDVGKKWTI